MYDLIPGLFRPVARPSRMDQIFSPLWTQEWRSPEDGAHDVHTVDNDDGSEDIFVALPGVSKEAVTLTASDGIVTVSVEEKSAEEKNSNKGAFYRSGRWTVSIPKGVDPSGITAKLEDGVLKIHIPAGGAAPDSHVIEIA